MHRREDETLEGNYATDFSPSHFSRFYWPTLKKVGRSEKAGFHPLGQNHFTKEHKIL